MRRLANDFLELVLVPEIGGKIISLKMRNSPREWIWHARTGADFRAPAPGDDFASTNLGGIDECLPTVKPQEYGRFRYSDHGEVWQMAASVKEASEHLITMETVLSEAPLCFRRMIFLENHAVHFRYELENLSDDPVPFLWAFHPLLNIESGDLIEIDPVPIPVRADYLENLPGCVEGEVFAWPQISGRINLAHPPIGEGSPYCAKLFFKSQSQNTATLIHEATSERLTLSWSGNDCPWFGLWLTSAQWNGHTHVAFEPTNHPSDRFLTGSPPLLKPFASAHWKITISLYSNCLNHGSSSLASHFARSSTQG